jgi:hypothetical protein
MLRIWRFRIAALISGCSRLADGIFEIIAALIYAENKQT